MTAFKPKQLVVVTLWAEDIHETAYFYRDVIGLELLPLHDAQPTFIVGDGVHLIIRKGKPVAAQNAKPFPIIAFEVDDLDYAISQLVSHGVSLATEIITNPSAKFIVFNDPAGNLLEFAQLSPGAH